MRKISIAELPVDVRPLVESGWTAVVYKGIQVSGVFPDMARDNWHRADNAIKACAPVSAEAPAPYAQPAS